QHTIELVPTANDETGRRNHAVGALAARQLGILFDAVDGNFGASAKNGKDRTILQEIDCIVAPLTSCDLTAIETKQSIKLSPIERHLLRGDEASGHLAPKGLAWFCVAWTDGHRRLLLELPEVSEMVCSSRTVTRLSHADDRAGCKSRQEGSSDYLCDAMVR